MIDLNKFAAETAKANNPDCLVELRDIWLTFGEVRWGAPRDKRVFTLRLGDVLETKHIEK